MESSLSLNCSYDPLFEILSGCSLKVVDKSKLISKFFNELTSEHAFIQYHKKKTGTIYGYILYHENDFKFVSHDDVDNTRSTLTFDFLPSNSTICLGTSDQGILCYTAIERRVGINRRQFYVCKPTTKQTQILPYPTRYEIGKMALVVLQSNPLRYKIVGLSLRETNSCEIFDSQTWSWKQLEIVLPIPFSMRHKSVLACGRLHWLLSKDQVLAFDIETETYTFFTLPVLDKENYVGENYIQLVKYRGKLGLICEDLASFEIWVMQDYKNQVWKMINKIDTESLKRKHGYCVLHALNLYASNVALIKGRDYMFYNFEDSSFNVAKLDQRVTDDYEVLPFRSDLERVDLRGKN